MDDINNEIECAIFNAGNAWLDAKRFLDTFDLDPSKAMIEIDEAINKLMEAHGFLRDAVILQKKLNNLEAAA